MLTVSQMRQLLAEAGLAPRKRLGQSFLIDGNLMQRLVDMADLTESDTVLEVGPATGSLTEELLARAGRVVAVEIDRGLARVLTDRLGDDPRLTILTGDVLAGKHAISPAVLAAVGAEATLVSNLPYNIATPLIVECLASSWRAMHGCEGSCRFGRLIFTVQAEVADRIAARPGGPDYGPVSVVASLLGNVSLGLAVPPSAFWPKPKVNSRIMRIDFDAPAAEQVSDLPVLQALLALAFGQRRKQIRSIFRKGGGGLAPAALAEALACANVPPDSRPQRITPNQFAQMARHLAQRPTH